MSKEKSPQEELLSICSPREYKDFTFEIIIRLTDAGYLETMTKQGRDLFLPKIQGLYNFFARLEQEKIK